jgi:hypothetical protein
MSARRFSRNVPRAVQHAVLAAEDLADEDGVVVGGMAGLQLALNHDSASSTRHAVSQAEAWGFLRRTGHERQADRGVVVVAMAREARRRAPDSRRTASNDEPERRIDV